MSISKRIKRIGQLNTDRIARFCLIIALSAIISMPLFADDSVNADKLTFSGPGTVFKLSPVTDGILLGMGASLIGTELVLGKFVMPKSTSFDGKILDRQNVNAFDRWAMNDYSKPLHITATVLEGVALLSPAVLMASPKNEWCTIGTMYAETVMIAYGVKELGKALINRARPYMYFEGFPEGDVSDGDWLCSTPSGHTTMSFAGAVFASYVFSEYFPDSPFKIPVIAGSLTLATGIAVMRIMSGNHFLSDVLAGAVIGSATGFLVPFVHTLNKNPSNNSLDSSRNVTARSSNATTAGGSYKSLEVGIIPNGLMMRYSY